MSGTVHEGSGEISVQDVHFVGTTVYPYPQPQSGYICSKCGVWVGPYVAHVCSGVAPSSPTLQWYWPSKAQQCDHCYCAPASDDHKRCCKCQDVRLKKFVGKDGR